MGEIATWSAVKTKVGLGKDGNDCPTKAELLALSPTGTGESYVGLELSNASSYKDTECVKLEDIHKVTYKYIFTLINSTLNFTALGGAPTNENTGFGKDSYREKYLDGVTTGIKENVSYNTSGLPSWITWTQAGGWVASENTELTARSKTDGTIVQQGSGKTFTIGWTQAAASQSWSYGWSVNPTSMSFGATGGTKTFTVTSYKQEVRNGHNYGNQITLTYTRENTGVTGTGTSVTMANNTSTSAKSGSVVLTQAETNKKLTISCSQSAGYRTYSEITASGGAVTDIPASGGTRSSFTTLPTYSQTWGWNGSTTGGGTITTGASISYGTAVSASSLGTTAKSRTLIGNLVGTLSLNGKTKAVSVDVYQAENKITSTTDGTPVISLSANSYTIPNTGGSVNISASVSIPTTNHWSSGSTSAGTAKSATPTVGVAGNGFSLNAAKTVLTASENTSTASRTGTVTAVYTGATTKNITITQSAASVTYNYTFTDSTSGTSSTTLSVGNSGALESISIDTYKTKYINGISSGNYLVAPTVKSKPDWVTVTLSPLQYEPTRYEVVISVSQNTSSARSGNIVLVQDESGKEITISVSQTAGSVSYNYYFTVSPGSLSFSSSGATEYISVSSYRKQVINGVEQSQILPVDFTLSGSGTGFTTNPGMGTVTPGATGGYNVTVTASKNSSTSSRGFTLGFTQTGSNKKSNVTVSQAGVNVTYNYTFKWVGITTKATTFNHTAVGNTLSATILSYRKRVVDGVEESTIYPVSFTFGGSASWASFTPSGSTITPNSNGEVTISCTASENVNTSQRAFTRTFTQEASANDLTLNINQAAATITYEYVFEIA